MQIILILFYTCVIQMKCVNSLEKQFTITDLIQKENAKIIDIARLWIEILGI